VRVGWLGKSGTLKGNSKKRRNIKALKIKIKR
jgi:hypothetical protein